MAITQVDEIQDFNYTGDVQEFTVPFDGLYKLEVKGAGRDTTGAYAVRYIPLKKDSVLYIVCGGQGGACWYGKDENQGSRRSAAGGYNGGGEGSCVQTAKDTSATGGSGATHIAIGTNRGVLANYVNNQDEVLIVAGGSSGTCARGGTRNGPVAGQGYSGSGNAFGDGQDGGGYYNAYGGGGGGWYGGNCGAVSGDAIYQYASGGSSYIGVEANESITTYKGETYNNLITAGGGNDGDGSAIITYIAKATICYLDGNEVTDIIFNGVEITSLIFDGTKIF